MKSIMTNYVDGCVTLEAVEYRPIQDYFEEAVEFFHDDEAKKKVHAFLEVRAEELLRQNGLPMPMPGSMQFPIEVGCIILKINGKEIEVMPQDLLDDVAKKYEAACK